MQVQERPVDAAGHERAGSPEQRDVWLAVHGKQVCAVWYADSVFAAWVQYGGHDGDVVGG